MDKLQTIQIFIEVAKQQSFVAASDVLGIAAPVTTRAVAELEHRIGVKLFHRTTRLVRLTEAGEGYFQDAKRIVEELADAEAAASGIYSIPKGTLNITAPVLFGEKHVVPVVSQYLKEHPEVSVKLTLLDRVTNLLEEGFDIAIRIGHLKDSNLYATNVGYVRQMVCGSPEYFAQYGIPQVPEDLTEHQIIQPSPLAHAPGWFFQKDAKRLQVKFSPRLVCNHNGAALKAAIEGIGVTRLMSYQAQDEIETGRLQCVLSDYELEPLPVNLVHLEGRRANAKVQHFMNLAVRSLLS